MVHGNKLVQKNYYSKTWAWKWRDSGMEMAPTRNWCMGTNLWRKTTTARLGHGNGAHQELVHGNKLAVKKNRNQE